MVFLMECADCHEKLLQANSTICPYCGGKRIVPENVKTFDESDDQPIQKVQKTLHGPYQMASFGAIIQICFAGVMFLLTFLMANSSPIDHIFGLQATQTTGMFLFIGVALLTSAIVVLVSAKKMLSNPLSHLKWGVLILVFSLIGWGSVFILPAQAGAGGIPFGLILILVAGWMTIVSGIEAIIFKQ